MVSELFSVYLAVWVRVQVVFGGGISYRREAWRRMRTTLRFNTLLKKSVTSDSVIQKLKQMLPF